jgi:hypothetical protein
LAKKGSTGPGVEVQVTTNSMDISGGEREQETKDYIAGNYAIVTQPATPREVSLECDSDKNAVTLLEMLDGDAAVVSGVSTISGGGEQKYYRFVYVVETYNADTTKIESRRWTLTNALCSATDITFPADDAVSFTITAKSGVADYKFEQTLDKDTHPLPTLGDY